MHPHDEVLRFEGLELGDEFAHEQVARAVSDIERLLILNGALWEGANNGFAYFGDGIEGRVRNGKQEHLYPEKDGISYLVSASYLDDEDYEPIHELIKSEVFTAGNGNKAVFVTHLTINNGTFERFKSNVVYRYYDDIPDYDELSPFRSHGSYDAPESRTISLCELFVRHEHGSVSTDFVPVTHWYDSGSRVDQEFWGYVSWSEGRYLSNFMDGIAFAQEATDALFLEAPAIVNGQFK